MSPSLHSCVHSSLQAFGVGAFEDEDEDIYATEDMSNYDFGEGKDAKDKGQGKLGHHNRVSNEYGNFYFFSQYF